MLDISVITFVISIFIVGLFLTAAIRRDFDERKRVRRDVERQIEHLRRRRRTAERP